MTKKIAYLVLILILLLAFRPEVQAQCAMCKSAAESSMKSNPASMARSLNSGILYLMAVPYLLIAFIFRKQLYQLWRRAFRKGEAGKEVTEGNSSL